MARTRGDAGASSKPAPSSKAAAPAPARAGRSATLPTEHDLLQTKEDALFQLKIGRTAHYYTLLLFGALFLDGLLLLALNPFTQGTSGLRALYYLVFPLGGAVLIAGFGIWVKWEAYQVWPWEAHFWVTVVAVPLAAFLVYLYAANLFDYGPTARWDLVPGFLPLALLGVALPLMGLTLTWREWSRRKGAAILAALLPVPLALILYVPSYSGNTSALTLTLVASGGLFLAAGSLLHLISSGTQAHEREVILSGQDRMFQVSEELRQREDAMRFREATLLRREADVEVAEAGLARKILAVEDLGSQLKTLETDLDGRAAQVHADFQQASTKLAESSQIQRELADRDAQLALREQAVQHSEQLRAAREKTLADGEGELIRRQLELANQEKEYQSRQQQVPLLEAKLETRRKELEARAQELVRTGPSLPSATGSAPAAASGDLAQREARVTQIQQTIQEQSGLLGRKARELDERTGEVRKAVEEQAKREQALVTRERLLSQREADLVGKVGAAENLRSQYQTALQRVEERGRSLEQQQSSLAVKLDEAQRRSGPLDAREAALRHQTEELQRARADLERAERASLTRERELEARESELQLRRASSENVGAFPPAGPSAAPILPPRPGMTASGSPPPAPPIVVREKRTVEGRVPSGLPRLDDLLVGGLPSGGQLLYVGPPFIGKEVAVYSFLAEGLKRGESAVIVTTSRSPPEVGEEIGMVAPQFREYEHLGRVHWVDASNPGASPSLEENGGAVRAVVKGPADFTGILAALASAVKAGGGSAAKPRAYRVAVLNLSTCLAQGEEKAVFGFVHNFVGILKPRKATAVYAVDPGTLTELQVESTLARMDGAIRFKQDRGKTLLAIQGMGEVATRDWVEYRATNRTIALGSFALERIR